MSRKIVRGDSGGIVFSETGEGCMTLYLKPTEKLREYAIFFYPGNLTVTKTRYPNSYLIKTTDCFGLDKKPKSLKFPMFFILHPERPFQTGGTKQSNEVTENRVTRKNFERSKILKSFKNM